MPFVTDALNELLRPVFGKELTCLSPAPVQDGAVNFIETDSIPSDGYSLTITPTGSRCGPVGLKGLFTPCKPCAS